MNKSVNFAVIGVGLLATMLALYMMTVTNLAAAQGGNMSSAGGGGNMTGAAGVNVTLKIAGDGSGDHGGSSKGDGGSSKGDGGSSKRHDGSSSG